MKRRFHTLACASLSAALLVPLLGNAAGEARSAATASPATTPQAATYSDRTMMKPWTDEKERLQSLLPPGQNKAWYTKALSDQGFRITAVLKDQPDGAEYEIVKGANSWEVDLDFDNAGKATKVEVETNLWLADTTEAVLRGTKVSTTAAYRSGDERYSDDSRMKAWTGEKDRLEKALATGHDRAYYASELKRMGYQVTSTNESDKDKVEYEVVKGRDTYEVQVDFKNGKGTDVHVSTNMWKSDETERALKASRS